MHEFIPVCRTVRSKNIIPRLISGNAVGLKVKIGNWEPNRFEPWLVRLGLKQFGPVKNRFVKNGLRKDRTENQLVKTASNCANRLMDFCTLGSRHASDGGLEGPHMCYTTIVLSNFFHRYFISLHLRNFRRPKQPGSCGAEPQLRRNRKLLRSSKEAPSVV